MSNVKVVILTDVKYEKNWLLHLLSEYRKECKHTFAFFPHEWDKRQDQINSHLKSYESVSVKYFARKCVVKKIDNKLMRSFCEQYHIQGSNKLAVVCFGIFFQDDLLGVLSLGRHHRNKDEIILDRMCFKSDVRVIGGASKMFSCAVEWAKDNVIDKITSYSDNRYSLGTVYEKLGFKLDKELPPDYFYMHKDDIKITYSKQSQKKKNVNCPDNITEKEWANQRGLIQVFDAGKKRWIYNLTSNIRIKAINRRRGYYKTKKGIPNVIYYQSSYELRAAYLLDHDDNVDYYKTQIHFNGSNQKRIIDFLVTYMNGEKCIIEIKPHERVCEFSEQIKDNQFMATKNNWKFLLWSEQELGFKSEYYLLKWADEYLSQNQSIDFVEQRKERNTQRSIKYYRKKIATDKVTFYCEFCKEEHTALRLTYDKNLARNGRYICEREGGHIAGSKPKLHLRKENPYAESGKKQCLKCKNILDFEHFGKDSFRKDGYASKCKECRRIEANLKYQAKKSSN